jgi:hypothetical protein
MILMKLIFSFNFMFYVASYSIAEYNPLTNPKSAAIVTTIIVGRSDIYDNLIKICQRESRCTSVGVHEIDAHLSPKSYWGQVRLGHLDRSCQKHGYHGRWSTRGPWGLNAASHWQYFYSCWQPELLDYPIISAWVATRKYLKVCDVRNKNKKLTSWCPKKRK